MTEERQPWINGAGTEVGNMVSNEPWDEVRVGHLHEDLGLPLSHKLPRGPADDSCLFAHTFKDAE